MCGPKKIKKAAEVLVGIASIAAVPGAATAGTAVAVGSGLWDLYSGKGRKSELMDSVALALQGALKSRAIARINDATVLLPQMVLIATPDTDDLTQAGWDADAVAAAMRQRVEKVATDQEHRMPAVLGAFQQWIAAGLHPLLNDPDFAQKAAPAIVRAMFARVDNIGARLDDMDAQTRDTLEAMALRFGEPDPEDMAWPALKTFLIEKAKDYRALRAEVGAIDDGLKQLFALKAAAVAAIDAGDLDKVESLLAQVHQVQLEEAAQTSELRAENALLRGRVEQAQALFSAAADSFAAVEPLGPTRRRVDAANRLVRHGGKFGGEATAHARDMAQDAIDALCDADNPMLYVEAYRVLGEALCDLGHRQGGLTGLLRLSEAADAFSAALSKRGGFASVEVAALTLAQLARIKVRLAHRTKGHEASRHYSEAQNAFRSALKYLDGAGSEQTRAFVTLELAQALFSDGLGREDQAESSKLFQSAEQEASTGLALLNTIPNDLVSEEARAVRSENISTAAILVAEARYHNALGRLNFDDPETQTVVQARLKEAISAYSSAIKLFPKRSHPVKWATNLLNAASLADMNATLAFASPETQLNEHILAANLSAKALEVFTSSDFPANRVKALSKTAQCLVRISENPRCPDPRQQLENARDAVDEVLRVCRKNSMSAPLRDAKTLSIEIRAALKAL